MNNKMHDTRSKNQTSLVDSRGLSLKNLSLEEGFVSMTLTAFLITDQYNYINKTRPKDMI